MSETTASPPSWACEFSVSKNSGRSQASRSTQETDLSKMAGLSLRNRCRPGPMRTITSPRSPIVSIWKVMITTELATGDFQRRITDDSSDLNDLDRQRVMKLATKELGSLSKSIGFTVLGRNCSCSDNCSCCDNGGIPAAAAMME